MRVAVYTNGATGPASFRYWLDERGERMSTHEGFGRSNREWQPKSMDEALAADSLRGAHLAREALGGYMALESYEAGLAIALDQLRAFAERYGLEWPHDVTCDMGDDCTCR